MLYGKLVVCLMFFLPTYRYNYAQYYAGIIGTSLLQHFVPSVYGIKLPVFYKVFSEKPSMVAIILSVSKHSMHMFQQLQHRNILLLRF